jgi:RNAse (barnase) inhibitor barstar
MNTFDVFSYDDPRMSKSTDGSLVVTIPPGIKDARQLFDLLFRELSLPNYFGFNWNALSDCLKDFHWIKQHDIVIVHQDLPNLEEAYLVNYLGVLVEGVCSWKPNEEHRLIIIFPETCRATLNALSGRG